VTLLVRDLAALPQALRGAAVAIGNFDGLHRGHAAVLAEVAAHAAAAGRPWGVLTFEPHPREFFRPDGAPFRLTMLSDKQRIAAGLGVPFIAAPVFDGAFAVQPPEDFIAAVLIAGLGVSAVFVGADFCFGRGRKGDVALLREAGAAQGFTVHVVETILHGGEKVSSSTIREHLSEGRPEDARRLLGRPWEIGGPVIAGDRRGRSIGFPTANLDPGRYLRPAYGVYAVTVTVEDGPHRGDWPGVANAGMRPTFGKPSPLIEAHLFDFAGDLYGAPVRVAFRHFLRPERKFDGLDALKRQIAEDAASARALLGAAAKVG